MKKGVNKNKEEGDTSRGSISFTQTFVEDSECNKDKENCTVNENYQRLPIKKGVTFDIQSKKKSSTRLVASPITTPEECNLESNASKIEKRRRRKLNIMFAIIILLAITTSCLVVGDFTSYNEMQIQTLFDLSDQTNTTMNGLEEEESFEEYELLPTPIAIEQPEARNYVAYIPVPLNDEESDEEYYDDDNEDAYYDKEDDDYYEDDEDYYEERKRRKKKKRPYQRRPNRRKYDDDDKERDSERIPFLVPLMMVPENQVGVQRNFHSTTRRTSKQHLGEVQHLDSY